MDDMIQRPGLHVDAQAEHWHSLGFRFSVFGVRVMAAAAILIGVSRANAQTIEPVDEFPKFELPSLSGDDPANTPAADRTLPGRIPADESTDDRERRLRPLPIERNDETGSGRLLTPVDDMDESSGGTPLPPDSTFADPTRGRDENRERLALPESDESLFAETLDWTQQPVSIADLELGTAWPFEHGKPDLNDAEKAAYVALMRAVGTRKLQAESWTSDGTSDVSFRSLWETAFYRYEDVRRQAWSNGAFTLQSRRTTPADPFAPRESAILSTTDQAFASTLRTTYSLRADMQSHPADFVGRPVALYGLFSPSGAVEVQATQTLEGEQSLFRLQRGTLRNLKDTETIALVDAVGFVDAETQTRASTAWPTDRQVVMPVLIKGWFVKLWGQRPLIFTETARVLTARPFDEDIRREVGGRRRVAADEAWLFYETLRQLQVTSGDLQAAIALREQQQRVSELRQAMRDKAIADFAALENDLQAGRIERTDGQQSEGYETRVRRLQRQVALREERYVSYQQRPDRFPVLVDVFETPDRWQGRLLTVRGHVRRVTTFAGDPTIFDGQPLHELWLYPDDSQSLPMVIVTPTLPPDFPARADVIDAVTVTGCFFKMYGYRATSQLTTRERHALPPGSRERQMADSGQSLNRLAPLVLAGHVQWTPSTEQVLALAEAGHLASDLPRVRSARANDPRGISDTVLLLAGFLVLIATMTVWGRVQRDRRERQRLRSLLDERPDFRQTSASLFPGPFSDPRIEPFRG